MTPGRFIALLLIGSCAAGAETIPRVLPGSERLELAPDWREQQRQEILRYLDRRIARTPALREGAWHAAGSPEARRRRLAGMTGFAAHSGANAEVSIVREGGPVRMEAVELTAADGFFAHALVVVPNGKPGGALVAVPPENVTAEEFAGSDPNVARAVRAGCMVAVMTPLPRDANHPLCRKLSGFDRRRIVYRLAFAVGKTLPGIEAEQAALFREYLAGRAGTAVAIYGKGQGGMTALLAAALEPRFDSAAVAGYFGPREHVSDEPVDRSIYGQLLEFGDAEIAGLIAPRRFEVLSDGNAAIGSEFERARRYYREVGSPDAIRLAPGATAAESGVALPADARAVDANFERLHGYLQRLAEQSEAERYRYWGKGADRPARMRDELRRWMGVPADTPAALRPRTRLLLVTDKYAAYEVMLGVLDGVSLYGHLLLPRGFSGRLPAVVCQHGLDGQPKDISGAGPEPNRVYHEFGRRLAERGYVVFAPYLTVPAPQAELINPIVRRAAALGMMRTAIEVRKLSRVVDYLQTLPAVDPARIGYYGLSYGGYSAIWMGPLEPRLKTVIVSGHFNDWRSKITNEELRTSYAMHPDEDFFNFNVLHRFTHPELLAAMLPRPVMIEFAENDTTTTPEWHARAWKQAQDMAAALGASERLGRDHFQGVHEIGGMRTLDWLDRWLRPDGASERDYTYLLWPSSRELPGLADSADDTYPFDRIELTAPLRDTFRAGAANGEFRGLALRLSRAGHPAPLMVRYGSKPGGADLGVARIDPESVRPLYDLWYQAPIAPVPLEPGRLYHVEIATGRASSGRDHYLIYGPKPLGGHSYPADFYFAYRPAGRFGRQPAFEFVRNYLERPSDPAFHNHAPRRAGEVQLDATWSIGPAPAGEVTAVAVEGLKRFLKASCGIELAGSGSRRIALRLDAAAPGVSTAEGFRVAVADSGIEVGARTARGLMRGIYWVEDAMRTRRAAILPRGVTTRNERFARRITTSILPGGLRYTETSRPLLYTDGLLERMSRDGFNGIWIWLNTEEAATGSKIFPELDDPDALERFARIQELTERARRFGIDVYVYLATGYNHWIPAWFYQRYPELKGYGFGSPMCTSDERVRRYHAEIVRNLVTHAPGIRGLVVIYDHEGFYYCGNTEGHRKQCPRCRTSTSEALALQVIENLSTALHDAGGPGKEFIAWSYGVEDWVDNVIPRLPKDVKVQVDFSKGGEVVRDGIHHRTGDYNLTLIGPPDFFERRNAMAARLGLEFITKTEHAVSQEFIFVPYIPAMEQWYRRIEKIRQYPAAGWFGNWSHYGYLASLPAQLINRMSFDPQPAAGEILPELARANYGEAAAPLVLEAWRHFSEGIRQFPYSDAVSRLPGPLQKGPSHPFFLDPKVKGFGAWRSWQNDLNWTKPWGPAVAAKYLGIVRDEYRRGAEALDRAARAAAETDQREAVRGEWRIARAIEISLTSMLNLIDWIQARDRFWATTDRRAAAAQLREIAARERANAEAILAVLDADSRIGYASEGGGVLRGGLFTSDLVRWKIGQLDDVVERQIPEALESGVTPPRQRASGR